MRKIAGYLTKNRSGKDQKIAQSTHENGNIKTRKTFWRNSKQKAVANGELCRIHYAVPRFELESDMDLNGSLQALGMNLAFTWDSDFSALSAPYAPITSIRQVTTLKVDEDGSEGAAVTVVAGETANLGGEEEIKEADFTLDRPFLFQITESATGTVLFMGKVGKPE